MARPTKGKIKPNQSYLKSWDEFEKTHETDGPAVLLPISVSIEDGILRRDRISSGNIAEMKDSMMADFAKHCKKVRHVPGVYCAADFERMLDEYIEAFDSDNNQGPLPPTPLDLVFNRPTWMLFHLPRDNWTFTEDRQYSVENDFDDVLRNVSKICVLNKGRSLLLANAFVSGSKKFKFNLHVTIHQIIDGVKMETPIIIDPGGDNRRIP